MKQKSKHAAMEMSVGTIVTIVLLMTVLILGLVLVRTIFSGAKNAVDLTNSQLTSEINKLFSADKKMVVYPGTDTIEMKRGQASAIGIGIKNLLQGNTGGNPTFDYSVTVNDPQIQQNCGISQDEAQSWIQGGSATGIPLPTGQDIQVEKVLFNVPSTAPICNIKVYVETKVAGSNYATDSFFMSLQ